MTDPATDAALADAINSDLVCVGSVHVPNHTCGLGDIPAEVLAAAVKHEWAGSDLAGGLDMTVQIAVVRVGRKRCPRCGLLRILFKLAAYNVDQPVGAGKARCLECAGLRPRGR